MRRSVLQGTRTPTPKGVLYYIVPPYLSSWEQLSEEDISYWGRTIGNTILCDLPRRPHGIDGWTSVQSELLSHAIDGERVYYLEQYDEWSVNAMVTEAEAISEGALDVWY